MRAEREATLEGEVDQRPAFLGEIGDGSDADQGYWPLERVPERVAAA